MPFANRIRNSISSRAKKTASRFYRLRYGSCAVLLYHRVADLLTDPQQLAVSPANFEKQLKVLNAEFNLLTVQEFKKHLETRTKFPKKSVLITFDDGYADNYLNAVPLLTAHKSEALFYICTGNIGTSNEFWWDDLERLLLCTENFPPAFLVEINGRNFTCSDELSSRNIVYLELLPVLRKMDFVEREKIFVQIRSMMPGSDPRESHRSVNGTELKQMSNFPIVTIGAHTVNHCSLNWIDGDEQTIEIQKSVTTIEKITGKKVDDFSYPFGTGNDFSRETVRICKKAGMKFVAANIPGCVHANSNHFSFPRFLVRNWEEMEFRNKLNGFYRK